MAAIAELMVELSAQDHLTGALERAEGGLSHLAATASSKMSTLGHVLTGAVGGLTTALAGPILGAVGDGFSAVTDGVIGFNASMETAQTAFTVLMGGADQAQAHLAMLSQFAAATPFELPEIVNASKLLQTFGGAALNNQAMLTLVGDAASGAGRGFEEVSFWTGRLYDAIQNGQPIGEAASNLQQMGLISGETRAKLEAMQESGVAGDEIWKTFTGTWEKFGGMMEAQSNTFAGRMSTMKDSLNQFFATAGKPIFDALSAGLGKFNSLLASPGLINFASGVAQGIAGAIQGIGNAIAGAIPKLQAIGGIISAVFQGFQTGNFNGVFGPILDQLDQLSSGAGTKLAGFVSSALSVFQVVRDAAITFWQAVQGNWGGQNDTRINGTVKLFGNVGTAIHDAAQWFTGTLIPAAKSAWDTIQSNFGRIMAVVGPFIAGFGGVLTAIGAGGAAFGLLSAIAMPVITGIGAALAFLTSPIGLIAVAVGLVAAAWVNNWGGIQGIVAGIVAFVTNLWTTIQTGLAVVMPVLQQLGTAIMAGIGGALAAIGPLVQQFMVAFQANLPAIMALWTQLQAVWQSAQPVLVALGAIIAGVVVTAIGVLMGAVGGLIGFFTGALPGAITMVSGILTALGSTFDLVAAVIQGVVGIVVNLIQGDWNGAWQAAQTMVSGVVQAIIGIVTGLGTATTGAFQALVGGAIGAVSGMVSTLTGYFNGLLSSLTGSAVNIQSSVGNAFSALGSAVSSAVSGMVSAVTGFFDSLVSGVTGAATSLMSAVTSSFQSLVSAVTSSVSGLVSAVTGFFSSLASQAQSSVSGLVSAVVGFFTSMAGQVGTAMSGLVSTVLGALGNLIGSAGAQAAAIGNAIINGIAGAISAGAGQLLGAIQGAVGGLVDKALGMLGIHSPSKVFAYMGEMSMMGLAQGIDAEADKPRAEAVKAIADAVSAATSALTGLRGFVAPDTGSVRAFADALDNLLSIFRDAAAKFETDALEVAGKWADAVGKITGVVSGGVDAFDALSRFVSPLEDAAFNFTEALVWLVMAFQEASLTFDEDMLDQAARFADTVGKVASVVGDAVDGLGALSEDFVPPSQAAIGALKFAVEFLVRSFGDSAAMFSTEFMAGATIFATTALAAVKVLADGVEGLQALNEFQRPTEEAIGNFKFAVEFLVRSLADSAAMFDSEVLAAAASFANTGGTALGIIGDGVSGLMALADFVAPSKAAIDAFAWAVLYVVQRFQILASHLSDEGLAQATAFSLTAKEALGAFKVGVDAFKSMEELSVPSAEAIDNLANGIQYVVLRMGAIGSQMDQDGLDRATAFADAASDCFAVMKAAIDTFTSIEKYKELPVQALDGLLEQMQKVLERMGDLETKARVYKEGALRFATDMRKAALAINEGMGNAQAVGSVPEIPAGGGHPEWTELSRVGGSGGGSRQASVTVNVAGSVLSDRDLRETIQTHVQGLIQRGRI